MRTPLYFIGLVFIATQVCRAHAESPPPGMVRIPGGSYQPLYSKAEKERTAAPFFLDITQVTNAQFLSFVQAHPEWRRSRVNPAQADRNYLSHWAGELEPGANAPYNAPVTNVSWFAAKACCEAEGKRLPTQDEWEFVARADATRMDASKDQGFLNQLLEWYSKPASAAPAGVNTSAENVHGARGLHGLVWEWVYDFNSTLIAGDSRADGTLERDLFCGAGSLLAADVSNYAAYIRYAFRSSLKGNYCIGSLGFRGARSISSPDSSSAATIVNTVYDLPGEWRTQENKPMKLQQLRGKVRVLTMGFTRCQYACSRIFEDMKSIEGELGPDADRVGFTFLSIDPEQDTPEKLAAKMSELRLDPAHWNLLTASDQTVRQTAVVLDFRYKEIDGFFSHSNLIAVLDPEGRIIHREAVLGAGINPTVEAVRTLLKNLEAAPKPLNP